MFKGLRDANIELIRQRVSEGDCPVTPALSVETLENIILDLAGHQPGLSLPGRDAGDACERLANIVRSSIGNVVCASDDVRAVLAAITKDLGRVADGEQALVNHARSGHGPSGFDPSRVERLALNLRSYAHARGAPETEQDEESALKAARSILTALEKMA